MSLIATRQACNLAHNPLYSGALEAAYGAITAKSIILPEHTVLYFPTADNAAEVVFMPNADLRVIGSIWGHYASGGRVPQDTDGIDSALKELLTWQFMTISSLALAALVVCRGTVFWKIPTKRFFLLNPRRRRRISLYGYLPPWQWRSIPAGSTDNLRPSPRNHEWLTNGDAPRQSARWLIWDQQLALCTRQRLWLQQLRWAGLGWMS